MPLTDCILINPSRRDLLKRLLATGVVGTTGALSSPLAFASGGLASDASRTIFRQHTDYEVWRKAMLWKSNAPQRFPDVIVQARSEREIIEALRFADSNDLQVVCRASGHNASASVLRNGGMLLDISALDGISVDPKDKSVYVGPGAKMIHLSQQLNKHGLDFPTASCQTVALGGYLLGGGIGANKMRWGGGPACYSILSADIILADGQKVTANKDQNADLYWAIRGVGPGFFGVVTRFRLRAYPSAKAILRSSYTYPIERLPTVIASLEAFSKRHRHDERVSSSLQASSNPEQPEKLEVRFTVTAYIDEGEDPELAAEKLLAPYANSEITQGASKRTENQLLQMDDLKFSTNPADRSNQDNFTTNDASAFIAIAELYKDRPVPGFLILDIAFDGFNHQRRNDASYWAKGRHKISAIMHWKNKEDDEVASRWFARFDELMKPYAISHYVNEINHEYPGRVQNSFGKKNWARLDKMRTKYDPKNRFYPHLEYQET